MKKKHDTVALKINIFRRKVVTRDFLETGRFVYGENVFRRIIEASVAPRVARHDGRFKEEDNWDIGQ